MHHHGRAPQHHTRLPVWESTAPSIHQRWRYTIPKEMAPDQRSQYLVALGAHFDVIDLWYESSQVEDDKPTSNGGERVSFQSLQLRTFQIALIDKH